MGRPRAVGDGIIAPKSGWSFSGLAAEKFDDHVRKSVPYYEDGHRLICQLSDYFIRTGSRVYDLGCSTGVLAKQLIHHVLPRQIELIGIDSEVDMVRRASKNVPAATFINDDICKFSFQPASFIVGYYIFQFIPLVNRLALFRRLYAALEPGGALVYFEKIAMETAMLQEMMSALYTDYRLDNSFSNAQIYGKSRSLRGILTPISEHDNFRILNAAGFKTSAVIFRSLVFAGFIAIKSSE